MSKIKKRDILRINGNVKCMRQKKTNSSSSPNDTKSAEGAVGARI